METRIVRTTIKKSKLQELEPEEKEVDIGASVALYNVYLCKL